MIFPSMMKFPLGRLVITPAALMAVGVDDICRAIDRHVCGLWGEVSDCDRLANETALLAGGRLLSAYYTSSDVELRLLTSADRLTTTVYLPDED